MSHDLIKFGSNDTLKLGDSHFALSAISVPSPEVHPPESRGLDLPLNPAKPHDVPWNSFYACSPQPYEFPMVLPPGYSSEFNPTSTDELRISTSDLSIEVLRDNVAPGSELSHQIERDVRYKILGQMESYCKKVFVGSVPSGITAADLEEFFSKFGQLTVDYRRTVSANNCGYAFVLFEQASSVNKLLEACVIGENSTHVIFLPCKTIKNAGKFVVIRAWRTSEGYWKNSLIKSCIGNRYSVFVGGVPRVCSAVSLAQVFDHKFGNVGKVVVELEAMTGFPKGVARITFLERKSYVNAINANRVKLFILKPVKEVEVKPYLESSIRCELCSTALTDNFCAGPECLMYICEFCWPIHCSANSHLEHIAMRRHESTAFQSPSSSHIETPHRRISNDEASIGFPTVLPPPNGCLNTPFRTNTFEGVRDNSTINTDFYTSASTRFDHLNGFRNIADLVTNVSTKRNKSIAFNSDHNDPQHRPNLRSLPHHRTPIGNIVSQEQMQDYSLRVFIGGLRMGVSVDDLTTFFTSFGQVNVEIDPSEEAKYAFLHFVKLSAVRALVTHCQMVNDRLLLSAYLDSKKTHISVEVRPWLKRNRVWLNGSLPINYDINTTSTRYSIFIGGVPRSTTASELAQVVQSHFGDLAVLMIDVDSVFEYPRGSARAVFLTKDVYVRALQQKFLTVFYRDQPRLVELKPFVDSDVPCEICGRATFRSFCPDLSCLKYFCKICWNVCHVYKPTHRPLRTSRMTTAERRDSSRRRGDKIVCPPMPYRNDNHDPHRPDEAADFLDGPGSSSMSLLSSFDHIDLSSSFSAPRDFGPIGSGRPN